MTRYFRLSFEFLAAGKPVVGCNLSSTSKIKRPYVYEYVEGSDPADFIAACDALLAADRRGSYEALRRELARGRDWNVYSAECSNARVY